MSENTFEAIVARSLARASAEIDKREGSVLYDSVAVVSPELVLLHMELEYLLQRADPFTAEGDDLDRKCAERGVYRIPASKAIRLGIFKDGNGNPIDLPPVSRFSGGDINYAAKEKIADGQYRMEAETPGRIGNVYIGTLFPINHINGLATAQLSDILIPGEDTEADESLRSRYMQGLKTDAFGGNRSDYIQKTNALQGVGGVKVYRAWQGGGTVKLVIIDSEYGVPSAELVDRVQTVIDPIVNSGEGMGIAPIDHRVTIMPVEAQVVDVTTTITYADGWSQEAAAPYIKDVLDQYYRELNEKWADSENIIVRISYIESRLLDLEGIVDIGGTMLNGSAKNLVLGTDEIVTRGLFNGTGL